MPRKNSTNWNVADPITSVRLNDINEDVDDIYALGDDRLKAFLTSGLSVEVKPGTWRVGSAEGFYAGATITLANNTTTYIMINSAGALVTSTSGWNTNFLRIARAVTLSGAVTLLENWRYDGVGGILGGGGFKNISSVAYRNGFVESFVGDGVTFNLSYNANNTLRQITNGGNTWTITYDADGKFVGLTEA